MAAPAMYDPYNYVSFVELNKRKRGEYERDPSERIENRTQKPSVKKIYIKKNGDPNTVKPKLYIWRQWQSPTLSQLLELVAPYVGIEEALFLYEPNGRRITHEEEVRENGLYYVTGDETFYLPHEYDPPQSRRYYHGEDAPHRDSNTNQPRHRDYGNESTRSEWIPPPSVTYPLHQSYPPPNTQSLPMYFDPTSLNEKGPPRNERSQTTRGRNFFNVQSQDAKGRNTKTSRTTKSENEIYSNEAVNLNNSYYGLDHGPIQNSTSRMSKSGSTKPTKSSGKQDENQQDEEEENQEEDVLTYTSPYSSRGLRKPLRSAKSRATTSKSGGERNKPLKTAQSRSTLLTRGTDYPQAPSGIDYDRDSRAPTQYERDGRYDRRNSYDRSESRYDRRDPYESRGNQYDANDRYNDDYGNEYTHERKARKKQSSAPAAPVRSRAQSLNRDRQRPRSIDDPAPGSLGYSDFDDEAAMARDRQALEKHKQKNQTTRRASAQIFNRKDQTHPDAYIIYVFLNGQGMECQFVSFQKKQLEKGMQFMLELVARRYNVNPARLCNMDGKKINEVSDLMSRGAYVLVPAGQSFRDSWYFLPDNAIDTSSDKQKVRERSAQRDRLIQRREKVESVKAKRTPAPRTKSQEYYRR